MLEGIHETAIAAMLLKSLSQAKGEIVPLFGSTYQSFFSPARVKPVSIQGRLATANHDQIVYVKKAEAIEYLKNKYNLLDRNELAKELQEASKDYQTETR